jgi:hypothetical protein
MYREVTIIEITEVLRLWVGGTPKKQIAARVGLDPKTVRHYVAVAADTGLRPGVALTDADAHAVVAALTLQSHRLRLGRAWRGSLAVIADVQHRSR